MSLDWENPQLLQRNRLPPRASGFPHQTRESAWAEDPRMALIYLSY